MPITASHVESEVTHETGEERRRGDGQEQRVGVGVGTGRPRRSDVLITGPSNKTHLYFKARKTLEGAVPPQIIGGIVINQECEQD